MRTIFLLSFLLGSNLLVAQEPEPYRFKTYKDNTCSAVKDQKNTGTCWAFSGSSLMESEILRTNKTANVDVSEMYIVRCIYRDKAENYIRRQGKANLSQGGLAHDSFNAARKYGLVPQEVYPGTQGYNYNHEKLEKDLKSRCDEILASAKNGRLPATWMQQIDGFLDEQFGKQPGKFTFEGKQYTPDTYRAALGIKTEDYITLTSFSHHPEYGNFILEIPDNFSNGTYYNLPLDELMRTINFVLQTGYTIAWDADVSNKGFSAKNGIAIVPAVDWEKKNDAQKSNAFKYREPQKQVTALMRQELFDVQETQDDHLMHIVGIQTEEGSGDIYYKVKNSWGEISDLKGFFYASEAYMRLNTIGITVNKYAIPLDIRKRLGLEPGPVNIEGAAPGKKAQMLKKAQPELQKADEK
jgi:bleomycin hydrolase